MFSTSILAPIWLRRLLAVLLTLAGLGLGLISLFGVIMYLFPPIKPPDGIEKECCIQYAPLLVPIPVIVMFAFGFSAKCLWNEHYPRWNTGWQGKMLILLHGFSGLISLAALWAWVMGVLLV